MRKFNTKFLVRTLISSLALAIFFILLLQLLPTLGFRIPSPDISSDYFRGFVCAILLSFIIFLLPARENERIPLFLIWSLRSVVTLGFMLYYEYTYGLDAYVYYSQAIGRDVIYEFSIENFTGTDLMIYLTRSLAKNVPLFASYHALKVLWSFIGYLGSYLFYRAYTTYTKEADVRLLWILGCFPSILFWSSILGKDPITYFGIALYFYGAVHLLEKFKPHHFLAFAMGLAVAGSIRLWLVSIFLIPFGFIYFLRSKTMAVVKIVFSIAFFSVISFFSNRILERIQEATGEETLGAVNLISRSWSRGGSGQEVAELTTVADFVRFLPKGMFAALFRPLPGEVMNLFGLLSGFENLILLVGILYMLAKSQLKIMRDPLLQLMFCTVIVWSSFYCFISYQNLGTAVRFKLQILPLLILFPYHIWKKHLQRDRT